MHHRVSRHSLLRQSAWVFLSASVLTLAMAWPVVVNPNQRLFGHEIVGRHADAYNFIQMLGERAELGGTTQPAVDWVGVWLGKLIGPVAAFNLLVLVSFPLAAAATYALARYLGLRLWPAVWAAGLFAFSPLHIAHAAYHPHVAQVQWLPLVLLALVAVSDRWGPLRASALLAATVLAALSNFYAAMMLAALMPVCLWILKRHPVRTGSGWRATLWTVAAAAVAGLLFVSYYYPRVIQDPAAIAFPAKDAQIYAARPVSYLTPPVDHPVLGTWGKGLWVEKGYGDAVLEQQVYVGFGALAAALLAVWLWRRRRGTSSARSMPLLLGLAAGAFLFSLPPLWNLGFAQIPSPSWLLHALAPMFRAYARFGFVVQLAVLLVAGLAWNWVSGDKRLRGALTIVAALAVFEFLPLPPWRWHPLYPHPGYVELENLADNVGLVDCTLTPQLASTVAPLVRGSLYAADGDRVDCAEPALAAKLASLGISHVLDRAGGPSSQQPDLTKVADVDGEIALYRVDAEPSSVYVRRWDGFSWREGVGSESLRWAGTRAAWWLSDPRWTRDPVRLRLELVAFPEPRDVSLIFNGDLITTFDVSTELAWFEVELPMRPFRNRVQFVASGDPAVPDQILGNGDRRRLAFAVGSIEYPPSVGSSGDPGH